MTEEHERCDITFRRQCAVAAMQGLLALKLNVPENTYAETAWKMADAMLAAENVKEDSDV